MNMRNTSFDFEIVGKHEVHKGSAVIVDTSLDVFEKAANAFKEEGNLGCLTVREIGIVEGVSQPGYREYYSIYETYTDSASDDYYYFAVPKYSEEI